MEMYLEKGGVSSFVFTGDNSKSRNGNRSQKKAMSILVTITIVEGTSPFVHAH